MPHPYRSSQSVCEVCSVPIYSAVCVEGAPCFPGPFWTRARVESVTEGHGNLYVSVRNGRLHVDEADPRILMSHSLFHTLFIGDEYDCSPQLDYLPGPDGGHQGAIIKIHAENGTFIYRVEKFISHEDGWLLAWPD